MRAGNVIGGGDYAEDRIIPDCIRALKNGNPIVLRNPNATRPWQHVLEPLNGYMKLGEQLLLGKKEFSTSFNFGPESHDIASVEEMCSLAKSNWGQVNAQFEREAIFKHEAGLLKLDITKARELLSWQPLWNSKKATALTINWYKNFYLNKKISSLDDLLEFTGDKHV